MKNKGNMARHCWTLKLLNNILPFIDIAANNNHFQYLLFVIGGHLYSDLPTNKLTNCLNFSDKLHLDGRQIQQNGSEIMCQ